jgi:hypothetical protein
MPVCPSVRMKQLGSDWTDFHDISYSPIVPTSVEKIQVSLKSDKNNGYFTWRRTYICDSILLILLRMRNASDKSCREKKHTLSSITFFLKIVPFMEKYGRAREVTDDNIKRRMRAACWITKATDTHSEYAILIAFPRQQWLRECFSMLRYT